MPKKFVGGVKSSESGDRSQEIGNYYYGQAILEVESVAKTSPELSQIMTELVKAIEAEPLPNLKDILNDIARHCYAWQRERWYYVSTAYPDNKPTAQTVTKSAVNFATKSYISVPDGTVYNFPVQPASAKSINIIPMYSLQDNIVLPAVDSPRSILRVTRNNYECKELPLASIMANFDLT